MPDYFVFWDEIAGRVRIHRADCEVCKFGKGVHNGGLMKGVTLPLIGSQLTHTRKLVRL